MKMNSLTAKFFSFFFSFTFFFFGKVYLRLAVSGGRIPAML